MDRKKVLVTGIGGNVGQGIIRNIRSSGYDIDIVGCNIVDFTAGNHLCDSFYKVPYAYDEAYIPTVREIVEKEQIDLVIPSTDFEVYYLALHSAEIPAATAVSAADTAEIYLDKYLSFLHHKKHGIAFADAYLPSAYKGQYKASIAKPRKGRGSRGLHINPTDWQGFTDEEYMIQELHKGQEITTAFYVTREGALHGFITLVRSLDNGATSQCKVVFEHNAALEPILKDMIRHGNIRGAANLQSIVTADGHIHPFEVNCRISGTNSIRSNFGFQDVKYTLQEYLYNIAPDQPKVTPGVAVRILMDVIYPGKEDYNQCLDSSSPYFIY